jgi:1-deoxy-D-xylulose-5-phosphate reductoisomerase
MSGTIGLLPTLAALEAGKRVAIATKEILVGFGEHVMRTAAISDAVVLPVDSELCAIHQCLAGRPGREIRRVLLTASGGPFRRKGPPTRATVAQVLKHPTWNMGDKITVDSATMMNKGLETIETARLFSLKSNQIDAVIHPGSIVHSLLEFVDGSTMAQLSHPDMRLPIQYCLTFPDRLPSPVRELNLAEVSKLEFQPIPRGRFPCYDLALRASRQGGAMPCVLNAANQVAVESFLADRIVFGSIPSIIDRTMRAYRRQAKAGPKRLTVRSLLNAESWATDYALGLGERPVSRKVN